MSSRILRPAPTANKPTVYDLTIDLSDWSCDADICGINGPCDACARRKRVAKLLAERDLERGPCTLGCTTDRPCERCCASWRECSRMSCVSC